MRWTWIGLLAVLGGCATTREVRISARPSDAVISIDNTARGRGPITQEFKFRGDETHQVSAERLGYTPQTVVLTRSYDRSDVTFDLQPRTKQLAFRITPVPGRLAIDGKPVEGAAKSQYSIELPFTVDSKDQWTRHVVQASRPGYQTAEQVVKWEDANPVYTLALDAVKKDVSIATDPPGAEVSLNGHVLGKTPLVSHNVPFPVDPKSDTYVPQKLTATKPGYDPVSTTISWDNGRTSYRLDLPAKSKVVRIATAPPGGTVVIDGHELPRDSTGVSTARITFPPVDEKGTLKTFTADVSKKTSDTEWYPARLPIAWDGGKTDYSVPLKEIRTRPVSLLRTKFERGDEGWRVTPEKIDTLAMKDVTEGTQAEPPVRITSLPRGTVIDSLAVSPDGQDLLFTTLSSSGKNELRTQIQRVRTDGSGSPTLYGDGRTLDLQPTFTPDGSQIVFASNRGGRRLSVWQMAANGEGGITQLTGGDTSDLWPSVDSDPRPRLFYQALVDSRSDPRLYMTVLGTTLRTDLTQSGGEQPRVSPKADAVVFTLANEQTGRHDIYRMSDRGGGAVNLTNSPDSDNIDPAWSKDGSRIAFASDRGADADGRHNFDIWVMNLSHPDKPVRVTTNGSWDDHPAWDPDGKYIYFRSNRGGNWEIWRVNAGK